MKVQKLVIRKNQTPQVEQEKIQETDSQKDIIYKEENGEKTPITQKTSAA